MDVSRMGLTFATLLVAAIAAPLPAAEPKDRIYQVEAVDAGMNAAKAKAVETLPAFYRALAAPSAGEGEFMVKFDIAPGDAVEFVWAGQLERSARKMTGILLNRPEQASAKPGDRVEIAERDIVDWTYRKGGVMQGSYTDRVLLARMPADEAAAYRAYLGWED
jgi:uncharacterized protein YegJ (DUF2314 family)